MSSFTHGLAMDGMLSANIVLANSTLIKASTNSHPEVFWAIRGAGSSFGVVTSYEFSTFVPPPVFSHFEIQLNVSSENISAAVDAWEVLQSWGDNEMPREMNLRFGVDGRGLHLDGLYHGGWDTMLEIIDPLLGKLGGGNWTVEEVTDWMGQIELYAYGTDLNQTHPYNMVRSS